MVYQEGSLDVRPPIVKADLDVVIGSALSESSPSLSPRQSSIDNNINITFDDEVTCRDPDILLYRLEDSAIICS